MKKAIFVDGCSLFNIGRILGIGKFNSKNIYDILVNRVGKVRELNARPLYVVAHHILGVLKKPLENIGFEVIAATSFKSRDDLLIKQKISQLNPAEVSEIVLVSADGDYYNCLKEKKDAGVAVYLVATDSPDLENREESSLSSIMRDEFYFIELGPFKDQIMFEPWKGRPGKEVGEAVSVPRPQHNNKTIKVKVKFMGNASQVAYFWAEFAELIGKYHNIEINSSVTFDDQNL